MQGDLFATKGMEYLLVIGYLFLLVACWRLVFPRKTRKLEVPAPQRVSDSFAMPDGIYYHQGHAWAAPESQSVMRVGMDDFAEKLIGRPAEIVLPQVGARLMEGEPGWQVQPLDGEPIPVLSPVDGVVVAVNPHVLISPELVNRDPYNLGWLMKVSVPSTEAARHNLLTGKLAHAWMDTVSERLRAEHADDVVELDDGGLARALSPNGWDQLAREFLLVEEIPTQRGFGAMRSARSQLQ